MNRKTAHDKTFSGRSAAESRAGASTRQGANDTLPSFLFRNTGGAFEETALLAGVSVPATGRPVDGQVRTMTTSIGYASSSHAPLHFGLGEKAAASRIDVRWPSGATQVLDNVRGDRVVDVKEP